MIALRRGAVEIHHEDYMEGKSPPLLPSKSSISPLHPPLASSISSTSNRNTGSSGQEEDVPSILRLKNTKPRCHHPNVARDLFSQDPSLQLSPSLATTFSFSLFLSLSLSFSLFLSLSLSISDPEKLLFDCALVLPSTLILILILFFSSSIPQYLLSSLSILSPLSLLSPYYLCIIPIVSRYFVHPSVLSKVHLFAHLLSLFLFSSLKNPRHHSTTPMYSPPNPQIPNPHHVASLRGWGVSFSSSGGFFTDSLDLIPTHFPRHLRLINSYQILRIIILIISLHDCNHFLGDYNHFLLQYHHGNCNCFGMCFFAAQFNLLPPFYDCNHLSL